MWISKGSDLGKLWSFCGVYLLESHMVHTVKMWRKSHIVPGRKGKKTVLKYTTVKYAQWIKLSPGNVKLQGLHQTRGRAWACQLLSAIYIFLYHQEEGKQNSQEVLVMSPDQRLRPTTSDDVGASAGMVGSNWEPQVTVAIEVLEHPCKTWLSFQRGYEIV